MEHKKINKEVETFLEFNQDGLNMALTSRFWKNFNGRTMDKKNIIAVDKDGNEMILEKILVKVK